MVLVVLTTLLISIIAIYSQLVVNQTAKLYNSENAFVQNMVTWHAAATLFVHNTPPSSFSTSGCMLTTVATGVTGFPSGSCSPGGTLIAATPSQLPSGYNPNYSFYSMAFQSPSGSYVLTFVCTTSSTTSPAAKCTTDSNNFIELPGGGTSSFSTGFTPGDLMSQLHRAAPADATYGTVTAAGAPYNTFTQAISDNVIGTYQTYQIPNSVPLGAVGIISAAN